MDNKKKTTTQNKTVNSLKITYKKKTTKNVCVIGFTDLYQELTTKNLQTKNCNQEFFVKI